MKKKFVFLLVFCSLLALAEQPLYLFLDTYVKIVKPLTNVEAAPVTVAKLMSPENNAIVPLLSREHKDFLDMPRDKRIASFRNKAFREEMQKAMYYQVPVVLAWHNIPFYRSKNIYVVVTIAENADFKDAVSVELPANAETLQLYNLKIGQKYYWKVGIVRNEACYETAAHCFETEGRAPRLVRVDGVPNVRDLGGRVGLGGKHVRQGLIYRTAGLNDNATKRRVTEAEAVKKDPRLKKTLDDLNNQISQLKSQDASSAPDYFSWSCSDSWMVFMPSPRPSHAQRLQFLKLTEMPDTFLGAKPKVMKTTENHCIYLSDLDYSVRYVALLAQEFESDRDGVVMATMGADWYWALAVNGTTIVDKMSIKTGNLKPVSVDNYKVDIPVKKGKNLLTVVLMAGSSGWEWYFAPVNGKREDIFKAYIDNRCADLTAERTKILESAAILTPGRNRVNDAMRDYLTLSLGIHSDIDLRTPNECYGMNGSPAGGRVKLYHYPSFAYAQMVTEPGKEAFGKVFKVFLDEKNYPILFHCIAGQDRTGAVAFILNALLGVSEEELYLDWEVTGFWNKNHAFNHKERFSQLIRVFREVPGNNYAEKAEAYVKSIGFTDDDIAHFRSIMLE